MTISCPFCASEDIDCQRKYAYDETNQRYHYYEWDCKRCTSCSNRTEHPRTPQAALDQWWDKRKPVEVGWQFKHNTRDIVVEVQTEPVNGFMRIVHVCYDDARPLPNRETSIPYWLLSALFHRVEGYAYMPWPEEKTEE